MVVGGDVEAVGVRVAEVGLDPALDLEVSSWPAVTITPTLQALAREQPVQHRGAAEDGRADAGKPSSGVESHWRRASSAESHAGRGDSSSGVVCALPTTNAPLSSTMNVSVMVPPASIARTRGVPSQLAFPSEVACGHGMDDTQVRPIGALDPIPFSVSPREGAHVDRHRRAAAPRTAARSLVGDVAAK